jgi:hypothetical protein
VKQLHRVGRLVEYAWPAEVIPAADGTLPYEALRLPLSVWPPFVKPRQREAHLSDEVFVRVLGVPRTVFYAMPRWRRERALAQAHLL